MCTPLGYPTMLHENNAGLLALLLLRKLEAFASAFCCAVPVPTTFGVHTFEGGCCPFTFLVPRPSDLHSNLTPLFTLHSANCQPAANSNHLSHNVPRSFPCVFPCCSVLTNLVCAPTFTPPQAPGARQQQLPRPHAARGERRLQRDRIVLEQRAVCGRQP